MTNISPLGITALLLIAACSSNGDPASDADVTDDADASLDADALRDAETSPDADDDGQDADGDEEPVIWHDPRQVITSDQLPVVRGYRAQRGIIHAHSPYSHDACDGDPFIDGARNEACFLDLRAGICATAQDFVFLTDHADLFAEHEFPDVLLYADGDILIERDGLPRANRLVCEDDREVIIAAGSETGTMPIGLERHVGDTPEARNAAYDDTTEAGVRALQEAGALVFLQHTEGWPVETILALPIDGIEIYNLHQNAMDRAGVVANLLIDLLLEPEEAPDVELGLIAIFEESSADMHRWSKSVAIRPTPGILATDVHQNTFSGETPDGERLDSFRRFMHWFSNMVLVAADEPVDDRVLKDAIAHGRLYGSFDYLGYPQGFDFHATVAGTSFEMGDFTPIDQEAELRLSLPSVFGLDSAAPQPDVRGVILRADDGDWIEVAEGTSDLTYGAAEPGVYRAVVYSTPHHLRPSLGEHADDYLVETVWVYSNPIYVGVSYD